MKVPRFTKWLGQVLRWVATIAIAGLFFFSLIVWFNIGRSFPQVDGQMRFEGLDGEIEILRDIDGVPHIYADTTHDLFFAQGLVEAQDRYWQMDFFRHVANGELSEMFGASQLETDKFLRTMGWGDFASAELSGLSDETVSYLSAYSQGVNAYTDDRSGGELSFEHFVLRLTSRSYTPDRWTAADSLAFAKVMAWDLSGNLDEELDRTILAGLMPVSKVEELYPSYPDGHPIIAPGDLRVRAETQLAPDVLAVQGLEELRTQIGALDDLIGSRGPDVGSNNWALSGALTSTGQPLLANDPHLGIDMPSIWYEVGLHCNTVSDRCPFDVVGFSLPSSPGVIIGHNADIARGITNLNPDEMDLYIEKINPENPNQYEYIGQWVDMDIHVETILVAGGESEQLVVRSTIHGPVIGDTYGPLEDADLVGIDPPEQYAVSMSWTALRESTIADAIFGLNIASDWDDFQEAASMWDIAGQNLVYADTAGNIGYQATGRIPIRAVGDGRWPVPGWTGEYAWTGEIPWTDMPRVFNPGRGYVASANQPLVDDSYPYHIHDDVAYGYRASRIEQLITSSDGPIDAEYMRMMQSDSKSLAAEILVPYIIGLDANSESVDLAKAVLGAWSFGNEDPHSDAYQMTGDEPGAALFASVWRHLMAATFHDDLPEDSWPSGGGRWYRVTETILDNPSASWWDDAATAELESRDAILVEAIEAAIDEIGDNPDRWDWTEMHTATFRNASFGQSGIPPLEWIVNSGAHGVPGGSSIINATSWNAADGNYDVTVLPSMRMIVDLSNLSASTTIHTTGQSGHPNHEHYDDMIERWIINDPHQMRWTRDDVEDAEANTLIIFPVG